MKKLTSVILFLVGLLFLVACSTNSGSKEATKEQSSDKKVIKYGKAAGPYTVLFEDAIIPILEKEGYQFKVVEFFRLTTE